MPAGRMASGMSPPASAVTAAMTVPSPPQRNTTSQPSATAFSHIPTPGSSAVVSSHSGSAHSLRLMNASTRRVIAGRSGTFNGL